MFQCSFSFPILTIFAIFYSKFRWSKPLAYRPTVSKLFWNSLHFNLLRQALLTYWCPGGEKAQTYHYTCTDNPKHTYVWESKRLLYMLWAMACPPLGVAGVRPPPRSAAPKKAYAYIYCHYRDYKTNCTRRSLRTLSQGVVIPREITYYH